MLLEKPQNEAVKRVLEDCYDAGRDIVLEAYKMYKSQNVDLDFLTWYNINKEIFSMKFKVKGEQE